MRAGKMLESLGTGAIVTWSESLKRIVIISRRPLELGADELREIETRLRRDGWEVRVAEEVGSASSNSDAVNGPNS